MAAFNENILQEKYVNKTGLAISLKIINQLTAKKLAQEQFQKVGTIPPPANAKYHVFWFNKKLQHHPIRTYVVYEYSVPPAIEGRHL